MQTPGQGPNTEGDDKHKITAPKIITNELHKLSTIGRLWHWVYHIMCLYFLNLFAGDLPQNSLGTAAIGRAFCVDSTMPTWLNLKLSLTKEQHKAGLGFDTGKQKGHYYCRRFTHYEDWIAC